MIDEIKPPIEEQTGLKCPGKSNRRPHERPSLFNAKIKTLSGFELWITPYNRVFLVNAATGDLGYPHLKETGLVVFDPVLENVPADVVTAISELLIKQKKLRRRMVEEGEFDDDDRWEWS